MSRIAEMIAAGVTVLPEVHGGTAAEFFSPDHANVLSSRSGSYNVASGEHYEVLAIGNNPPMVPNGSMEEQVRNLRETFVLIFVKGQKDTQYQLADYVGHVGEEDMEAAVKYLRTQYDKDVAMPESDPNARDPLADLVAQALGLASLAGVKEDKL